MSGRVLRLYIASNSAASQRAQRNLARLQAVLGSEWQVQVIDVLVNPELAERAGVLATPTLSDEDSKRPRRVIGDLSDLKSVLEFLGIEMKEA